MFTTCLSGCTRTQQLLEANAVKQIKQHHTNCTNQLWVHFNSQLRINPRWTLVGRVSKKERLGLKQSVSHEEPTSLCSAVAECFVFHTRRSSCFSRLFTGLSAPRLSAFFPAVRTRRRPHSSSPGDGCRHRCGRKPKAIYLCVTPPGETSSTHRLFTVSSLWGKKKEKEAGCVSLSPTATVSLPRKRKLGVHFLSTQFAPAALWEERQQQPCLNLLMRTK